MMVKHIVSLHSARNGYPSNEANTIGHRYDSSEIRHSGRGKLGQEWIKYIFTDERHLHY